MLLSKFNFLKCETIMATFVSSNARRVVGARVLCYALTQPKLKSKAWRTYCGHNSRHHCLLVKHLHDFWLRTGIVSSLSAWCRHRTRLNDSEMSREQHRVDRCHINANEMFSKYLPFTSGCAIASITTTKVNWLRTEQHMICSISSAFWTRPSMFLRQFKCSMPNYTVIGSSNAKPRTYRVQHLECIYIHIHSCLRVGRNRGTQIKIQKKKNKTKNPKHKIIYFAQRNYFCESLAVHFVQSTNLIFSNNYC